MFKGGLCLLLMLFLFSSCGSEQTRKPVNKPEKISLQSYVGQYVRIVGIVSNTKIPQIAGVDVDSFNPDLRGERAEVRGILESWEVTEQDLGGERTANRGVGVFYRIKNPNDSYTAHVYRVEDFNNISNDRARIERVAFDK